MILTPTNDGVHIKTDIIAGKCFYDQHIQIESLVIIKNGKFLKSCNYYLNTNTFWANNISIDINQISYRVMKYFATIE